MHNEKKWRTHLPNSPIAPHISQHCLPIFTEVLRPSLRLFPTDHVLLLFVFAQFLQFIYYLDRRLTEFSASSWPTIIHFSLSLSLSLLVALIALTVDQQSFVHLPDLRSVITRCVCTCHWIAHVKMKYQWLMFFTGSAVSNQQSSEEWMEGQVCGQLWSTFWITSEIHSLIFICIIQDYTDHGHSPLRCLYFSM